MEAHCLLSLDAQPPPTREAPVDRLIETSAGEHARGITSFIHIFFTRLLYSYIWLRVLASRVESNRTEPNLSAGLGSLVRRCFVTAFYYGRWVVVALAF
jgi:hypothetical protein